MEGHVVSTVLAREKRTWRGRRPEHAPKQIARESGEPGCIGHGAIHSGGAVQRRARREGSDRTPRMNALRQSDCRIVPAKSPNKSVQTVAEGMEGRRRREGNATRQLAYTGRRAGKLCGKRNGRRHCVCRDDPSEEPDAGKPLVRICAGGGP